MPNVLPDPENCSDADGNSEDLDPEMAEFENSFEAELEKLLAEEEAEEARQNVPMRRPQKRVLMRGQRFQVKLQRMWALIWLRQSAWSEKRPTCGNYRQNYEGWEGKLAGHLLGAQRRERALHKEFVLCCSHRGAAQFPSSPLPRPAGPVQGRGQGWLAFPCGLPVGHQTALPCCSEVAAAHCGAGRPGQAKVALLQTSAPAIRRTCAKPGHGLCESSLEKLPDYIALGGPAREDGGANEMRAQAEEVAAGLSKHLRRSALSLAEGGREGASNRRCFDSHTICRRWQREGGRVPAIGVLKPQKDTPVSAKTRYSKLTRGRASLRST